MGKPRTPVQFSSELYVECVQSMTGHAPVLLQFGHVGPATAVTEKLEELGTYLDFVWCQCDTDQQTDLPGEFGIQKEPAVVIKDSSGWKDFKIEDLTQLQNLTKLQKTMENICPPAQG